MEEIGIKFRNALRSYGYRNTFMALKKVKLQRAHQLISIILVVYDF